MKPYHLNLLFIKDEESAHRYPHVYVRVGASINVKTKTGSSRVIGYTAQTKSEFDGMIDQLIAELNSIREQAHLKFAMS